MLLYFCAGSLLCLCCFLLFVSCILLGRHSARSESNCHSGTRCFTVILFLICIAFVLGFLPPTGDAGALGEPARRGPPRGRGLNHRTSGSCVAPAQYEIDVPLPGAVSAEVAAPEPRQDLGGPAPSTLAAWRERSRFREGQVAPVVEQRLAELAGPSDSLPLRLRQLVGQLRHLRSARRVELRQLVGSLSGAQVSNGQETRKAAGSPQRAEVAQREGCAPRAWACARRNHRTIQPFQRRKDSSSDSLETTGGGYAGYPLEDPTKGERNGLA